MLRRTPKPGAYVGNIGRGGTEEYVDLPAELADALPYFAAKIPIPFLCADFLFDGNRFWLSEIEPDSVISSPDRSFESDNKITLSLMEQRFRAYRRGHARWLASRAGQER